MLSMIPFLSSPVSYALEAYQGISFELPLEKTVYFIKQRVHKEDLDYDKIIKNLPGYNVKKQIQPFLDKEGIREDLIVVETPNLGIGAAVGTNLFKGGDAVVVLTPGLHEKDKDASNWLLKHEISHIKNNDIFTIPLIATISSTAAAVFGTLTMPWLSATLLTMAVGLASHSLFSQWREGKADDFAIENSSNNELLGARRVLTALQQMNLMERQSFWTKIEISSSGNNRFDLSHPSLESRIEKVEKVIREKGLVVDKDKEALKIKNLKLFLIDKNDEIMKTLMNDWKY